VQCHPSAMYLAHVALFAMLFCWKSGESRTKLVRVRIAALSVVYAVGRIDTALIETVACFHWAVRVEGPR
jgi:hypothetical protein